MNAVLGGPGGGCSLFSTVLMMLFVTIVVLGGGTAVVTTTRLVSRSLFLRRLPMPTPRQIHMQKVQAMIPMTTPAIIPATERESKNVNYGKPKIKFLKHVHCTNAILFCFSNVHLQESEATYTDGRLHCTHLYVSVCVATF